MKYDSMYMQIAERVSDESRCPRTQVGCLILAESGMTALGFNGHASGGPNEWEFSTEGNPEVVHAELNALGKMLEQGVSAKGATVYVTLSPCLECSKLLVRAKVKRVVYSSDYRKDDGINYLHKYGVIVDQLGYSDWGHEPYLRRYEGQMGKRVVQKAEEFVS